MENREIEKFSMETKLTPLDRFNRSITYYINQYGKNCSIPISLLQNIQDDFNNESNLLNQQNKALLD